MTGESCFLLVVFVGGGLAGLSSPRWLLLSGWAALAFALLLAPLGVVLSMRFC
jgi:hypothetical protein